MLKIKGILLSLMVISPGVLALEELVKHPNVLFISLDDMNDWVGTLAGHEQTGKPLVFYTADSFS